jgi:sulfopyruvate decarboxylase TPP-binding subunit
MGQITEPTLKLAGFQTYRVEQEVDVEPMVESACRMAFGGGNLQIAVLLSQRMIDRSHQGH